MPYKTTEHKKAIIKMVKEKRMILQYNLAALMNRKNIKYTVEILVEEGKVKRQKIKNRGKVGNLSDVWLVYHNSVKQEEILEFEREMINKPFTSPLVNNHCYKSPEKPVEAVIKADLIEVKTNVIDMQEYIKINKTDVKIKEYKGQRVVSIYDVAKVHEVNNKTIKENFNNNKQYLIQEEDYFILSKVEYEKFANEKLGREFNAIKEIVLFTEQGYLLIVKSLTGEKAWKIQRQLVKSYFKIQELKTKQENNLPITKQDLNSADTYDILKVFASGITDLNERMIVIENKLKLLAN